MAIFSSIKVGDRWALCVDGKPIPLSAISLMRPMAPLDTQTVKAQVASHNEFLTQNPENNR